MVEMGATCIGKVPGMRARRSGTTGRIQAGTTYYIAPEWAARAVFPATMGMPVRDDGATRERT